MQLLGENNQLKVMERVINLEKFVENCDEKCLNLLENGQSWK